MRVITNTNIIKNRSKWAKRVAPLTMVFLVGGFIANIQSYFHPEQPLYFQGTMVLLALGFILATISSNLVNNWVREPRADQILTTMLKKFGNDFMLFNYTSATPHILLTPTRLYTITVKNLDGQVTVKERRVSKKFTWSRLFRFFADEGLGSPISEAENNSRKLYKFLNKNLAGEEMPEIQPLVLFSNKDVDLLLDAPPIPVIRSNQLKSYLREHNKSKNISTVQRKSLISTIGGQWKEVKAR